MVAAFLPYLILSVTYLWLAVTGSHKEKPKKLEKKGK